MYKDLAETVFITEEYCNRVQDLNSVKAAFGRYNSV